MEERTKLKLHLLNSSGKSIFCTGRSVSRGDSLIAVTNSPAHVTCLACLRRMYKAKQDTLKSKSR